MKNKKMTSDEIKENLRNFISTNFLPFSTLDSLEDGHSLMEQGIIDSTGILELIAFLEETFDIRVQDEEIIPDNLDTINYLSEYLARKMGATNT